MRIDLSVFLFAALTVMPAQPSVMAQSPGEVSGFVLDEAAGPVAGAEVSAFPADRPSVGILRHSFSGADGSFLITGVIPGVYQITAEKLPAGFGNPMEVLFESPSAHAPTVEVAAGETTKGVTVRLGPRGGWVSGVALDGTSGKAVRGAVVGLVFTGTDLAYATRTVGDGGNFRLLLPSDKGVRLRLSAPGHETWYYGTDGTEAHATPLKMSPGETKEIVVRLRPLKSSAH